MKNPIKTTVTRSLITLAVASTFSLPALAGKGYGQNSSYGHASYDYAKVVEVNPIFERYEVNHPVEQCYHKEVPVRKSNYRNKSRTPEIVGAIIGGVIGNQVGKNGGGSARDVATVAGAVLGGSIGRDVKHKNNRRYNSGYTQQYKTVKHCELRDNYVSEKKLVGYDVAYKYNGKVFHTQTDYDPGRKIRVQVSVNPA